MQNQLYGSLMGSREKKAASSQPIRFAVRLGLHYLASDAALMSHGLNQLNESYLSSYITDVYQVNLHFQNLCTVSQSLWTQMHH